MPRTDLGVRHKPDKMFYSNSHAKSDEHVAHPLCQQYYAVAAQTLPTHQINWPGVPLQKRASGPKATGISVSAVQRIWRAHGLQPHRVRQFKLCNDPDFV